MQKYLRILPTWTIKRFSDFNPLKKFSTMQDSTPRKYKVFITTRIPNTALDLLGENGGNLDIRMRDSIEPISHEELLKQVVGIDVLYCFRSDTIDKTVIEKAGPNLKVRHKKFLTKLSQIKKKPRITSQSRSHQV